MVYRFALILIAAAGLAACSSDAPPVPPPVQEQTTAPGDKVVGKVGDHPFTDGDIDREFATMPPNFQAMKDNPQMRANILNNIMTRFALAQEARTQGIDQNPEVAAKLRKNEETVLIEALRCQKMNSQPTDAEIEQYYQTHIAAYGQPEQVHARHILVKTEEEARKVLKKLKGGMAFDLVAKQFSQDAANKDKGGDLGWFGRGTMVPPFEQAIFALTQEGEIAGPVQTQFGWHIVELLGRRAAQTLPLEQVKDRVAREMNQASMRTWVEEVKHKQNLTFIDPRYAPPAPPSPPVAAPKR